MGHEQALCELQLWRDAEVVVLDAADEGRAGDHFPGVRVLRHIRLNAGSNRPTIVVVTGHFFDDGLRRRMADADADFFFLRPEIRSPEKLIDIVLNPENYRRGVPPVKDKNREALLGITDGTTLDDFIGYVEGYGLAPTLDRADAGRSPVGRRALIRHRKALAKGSRIDMLNISTGTLPSESQKAPSMRQIRKIWTWAARVKYPDRDPAMENWLSDDA